MSPGIGKTPQQGPQWASPFAGKTPTSKRARATSTSTHDVGDKGMPLSMAATVEPTGVGRSSSRSVPGSTKGVTPSSGQMSPNKSPPPIGQRPTSREKSIHSSRHRRKPIRRQVDITNIHRDRQQREATIEDHFPHGSERILKREDRNAHNSRLLHTHWSSPLMGTFCSPSRSKHNFRRTNRTYRPGSGRIRRHHPSWR